MIKRKGDQWTTIQCQNCKDCHKVLNGKHMRALLCPYCGTTIMLDKGTTPVVNGSLEELNATIAKQFPQVREEDTVGYQRTHKGES